MFIQAVKDSWKQKNVNNEAAVELWNAKADYFGKYDLEDVEKERFIQIIKEKREEVLWNKKIIERNNINSISNNNNSTINISGNKCCDVNRR